MKMNITVSIDVENYIAAKRKLDNLSDYVNTCFKSLAETIDLDDVDPSQELTRLNNTIQDAKIKRDILIMEQDRKKELESAKNASREHLRRWVCPVDGTINIMEEKRCGGKCGLPIRDDPQTSIIYVDEVKV